MKIKIKNKNKNKNKIQVLEKNRITMKYHKMTSKKEIHEICKIYRLQFHRFGHKQNCIKNPIA